MQAVPALIVSDFTSPFCWLAEAALRRLAAEGRVSLEYLALELFPAPGPLPEPPPVEPAAALAAELGLTLHPPAAAARSRKAHELTRLARERGCEEVVREKVFAAYFSAGQDIARIDVLVELAREAGLDRTEAKVVLDVDRHAPAVQLESAAARQAGIDAVPVVLLGRSDRPMRVEGAFSLAEWRALIEEAERTQPSQG
jgi:predicted DsbA family dithiol-disulfide isomerase